jgi:sugar lactone lactonase YvrE
MTRLETGRSRGGSIGALPVLASLVVVTAALLPGCAGSPGPVFPEPETEIVWPPPPLPARVRWVGELRSSEDLGGTRGFFETIGDVFTGPPEPENLYGPRAVVLTPDGRRLWIADIGGRCLHRFDLEDRSYLKRNRAGESLILSPVDLCLGPDGSIFVCDSEGVAIHRISDEDGALVESLRIPDELGRPVAISWRETTGELFVVDVVAHDVKVLASDGSLLRILGRRGEGPGEFNFPVDIADDGTALWIVDSGNHRVQGIDADGSPRLAFGQVGDSPGDLALPKGVALDSDGHVYVVDARFENVQIFDPTGRLLLFFGGEGVAPGEFWLPSGIHIDRNDRIWICDSYNGRVQVFDYVSRSPASGRDSR